MAPFVVNVLTLNRELDIQIDSSDTVRQLKQAIRRTLTQEGDHDLDNKHVRLIHLGHYLEDDEIVFLRVGDDAVVHCVVSDIQPADTDDDDDDGRDVEHVDLEAQEASDRRLAARLQGGGRRGERRSSDADGPPTEPLRDSFFFFLLSFVVSTMLGFPTLFLVIDQSFDKWVHMGLLMGMVCHFMLPMVSKTSEDGGDGIGGEDDYGY